MASSSSSVAWVELPPEITALILQKLSPVDILTSAVKVCREWRRVCGDPSMWRCIDMRMKKTDCYDSREMEKLCCNAVDRSQGQLIDFRINDFGSSSLLLRVAHTSRSLRCLQLSNTLISSSAIIEAIKYFPVLEELHLDTDINAGGIVEAIGRCCPLLKSLKLEKTYNCGPFVKCDLDARAIAENMPELRHLQLFANNMTDQGLLAILEGCPHLESLHLMRCYNVHFTGDLWRLCSQRIKNLSYSIHHQGS